MKVVRQWSDRRKKIEVPLFRSYVFVHLKPSEKNLVYDVPGILGFLNWLQKPAIVQKDEIDTIKSWLNNEGLSQFEVSKLNVGDEVEIKAGKMAGKKAVIESRNKKTVKLILPQMGWKLTAQIQDII